MVMPCTFWLLGMVAFGAMVYFGAILLGIYKSPLMAHFRRYGEDRRIYPLAYFVVSAGTVLLLVTPLIIGAVTSAVMTIMALLIVLLGIGIRRLTFLGLSLPRWYYTLLQITTREERRAIAYAWLRLPLKTRLRLSGDNYAFRVFVDEVRMTVIYGARDRDDPWRVWE